MIRNSDQEALWQLLQKVADFLEENDIKYYLFAGTAIGALRHKGFVPWDNDVDLLMDRENYEKMLSMADDLPWDDVELVSSELSDEYYRPYAQFSNKRDTSFLKTGMFNHGECMGTLIDVMCMDDIPSARLEEYKRDLLRYQETLVDAFTYNPRTVKLADEIIELKEECLKRGKRQVIQELKAKLESYAEEDCDECVVRFWGRKIRNYKKSWFEDTRMVPFEGRMMPVAGGAEACLRLQYGSNWYMIPRQKEQEVHDFFSHHEMSYNNYSEDLENFLDWEKVHNDLRSRKMIELKMMKYRDNIETYREKLSGIRFIMKSRIVESQDELEKAAGRGDYLRVTEMTDMLTSNMAMMKHIDPEEAGLSYETIDRWMYAVMKSGRYWAAQKIADAFCENTGKCAKTLETLGKVTELAWLCQDRAHDQLMEAVSAYNDDRLIPEYIIALDELTKAGRMQEQERIENLCDEYLRIFPSNCEIMKIKADLLDAEGRGEEAMDLYKKVHDSTDNGLLILELEERFGFEDRFL